MDIEDLYDIACMCHAGMAQDSPQPPTEYLNRILNYVWPSLTKHHKQKLEVYLAEKKYLPEVDLIL